MRFPVSFTKLKQIVIALALVAVPFGRNPLAVARAEETQSVDLRQFDMLTPTSGWINTDQFLYWTSDAGRSWEEIGPSLPAEGSIQDIEFVDPGIGWALWTVPNPDGSVGFQLAHTEDHGISWAVDSLALFEPGEIASYVEKAQMGWLDARTGWISVKQASGSNFSLGTLFTTTDGGKNWNRFFLPVADNVFFSDPQNGWAVGGPDGRQVYRTGNGGASWEDNEPVGIAVQVQATAFSPLVSRGRGLLVMSVLGARNNLSVYSLDQASGGWLPAGQVRLEVQPGSVGLSILDAQNFVAVIPGTQSIIRMVNGRLGELKNRDGLSASIVDLDMASLDTGWAKSVESECVTASSPDREAASVSCSSTTRLLLTNDGGLTWQSLDLPVVSSGAVSSEMQTRSTPLEGSSITNLQNTRAFVGQGFDRCEIPTLSQMQTWANSGPYNAVNLYIGGSSRACDNYALSSSYLFRLKQQGWKFIPTWVGPQASCTGFSSRMSSDVDVAYQQGIDEANLAVNRLFELGLTDPARTGSMIYYDIENYGTNVACREAVNSFMNGWVSQLHARGHLAGVYGSTLCNTGLSDFRSIASVPDAIWAARWYHNYGQGYYDPSASVWGLGSCIPDSVWANHQRIRQYEGDHDETWGGLTMNIDSNVLDGVVAVPFDYPFVDRIIRTDANPTNAYVVGYSVIFSKPVTGVDASDFVLAKNGTEDASIDSVSGSGSTYTVKVNTGSSHGTIRLDVMDNDSIKDSSNNLLGVAGVGNGNFNSGEIYEISQEATLAIGAQTIGTYPVLKDTALIVNRPNTLDGPVRVTSTRTGNLFTSQRVISGNSFNEVMGYPKDQLTAEYWFPWYDNVGMTTWILVGNASGTQAAAVDIYVGNSKTSYSIPPNGRITPRYDGIVNGPVRVRSTNGVKIFTSERSVYKGAFNEVMGYPANQFTTEYWFPWYDNVGMAAWILVGNPSTTSTANVDIYVGEVKRTSATISAGGSITPRYTGVVDGPVRVVSTNGAKIFASERSLYGDSFNEVMGYPANQFTTEYWFPWYDNVSMTDWVLVGNPSSTQSAAVEVYIGTARYAYTVPPGGRITPRYAGRNAGPVRVRSTNGVKIFTSQRVLYGTSFNEVMGYPGYRLTTEYWFPWYDSSNMSTDILVGRP